MIVNGVDVSTIGVIVRDRTPSRSAAPLLTILEAAPGAMRHVVVGHNAPEILRLHVDGSIVGNIFDGGTLPQLRANIDAFKFAVRAKAAHAVRWSDMTGDSPVREWIAYRHTLRIDDIAPGWLTNGVAFDLVMLVPSSVAQEASLSNKTTNGAAPLVLTPDLGTAAMPCIITIQGHSTNLVNPVVHYRDDTDTDITTIAYTGSLTAAQTLVIDTEFFTAEVNGSNVGGDISGSYFDIDPNDGGTPTGPDLQLTADSGNATEFKVEYKRRYS